MPLAKDSLSPLTRGRGLKSQLLPLAFIVVSRCFRIGCIDFPLAFVLGLLTFPLLSY
jgi:hypothetical protein